MSIFIIWGLHLNFLLTEKKANDEEVIVSKSIVDNVFFNYTENISVQNVQKYDESLKEVTVDRVIFSDTNDLDKELWYSQTLNVFWKYFFNKRWHFLEENKTKFIDVLFTYVETYERLKEKEENYSFIKEANSKLRSKLEEEYSKKSFWSKEWNSVLSWNEFFLIIEEWLKQ